MKKFALIVCLLVISLAACAPKPSDSEQARQALTEFFELLSGGDYAKAAERYGGGYETLLEFNPDLDPQDSAALWKNGCEINGLKCLTVRSAELEQEAGDMLTFAVAFNDTDGSLFVQGPCCGADETQSPPTSSFQVRVQKTQQGEYLVLDMPVYVP